MPDGRLTAAALQDLGLIAIIRARSDTAVLPAVEALVRGGVRAVEITLNTPGALTLISRAREMLGTAARVGAGTILDRAGAEEAFQAGAEFVVTPTLQPDTIACCREQSVPILCGCATPTESLAAHRAGADFIKVFPAETLGVAYIRALLAPLPFLRLIPTGGVSLETLPEWIAAGCVGVALGSHLVSAQILRDRDWDALARRAGQFVEALAAARADTEGSPV